MLELCTSTCTWPGSGGFSQGGKKIYLVTHPSEVLVLSSCYKGQWNSLICIEQSGVFFPACSLEEAKKPLKMPLKTGRSPAWKILVQTIIAW